MNYDYCDNANVTAIAINDFEEDDPFRIPNLDTVLYFQYSDAIYEFKKAFRLSMYVVAVRGY